MTEDKRKGILAGYKKLGPASRILFWFTIVSVPATVFGFILGLCSSEYYYNRSQRYARHLANITMSRPVPFVRKFPVIIEDGGNTQKMPRPGRYAPAFSRCPFNFFIKPDGSIYLRGEIRDAKGTIVIEGTGDSIRVVQADGYDINSDTKAIEVVDINQRPIFQLLVITLEEIIEEDPQRSSEFDKIKLRIMEKHGILDANSFLAKSVQQYKEYIKEQKVKEIIRMFYITQQGETWLVSSPYGIMMVENLEEDECTLLPRLFCYPGFSNPGKRVDK